MNKSDLILQTAREIFFEFGYKKATLDDIADRLQIQKGGIYYYFKNKEDLFIEVLKFQHEDYKAQTAQSIEGTVSFKERLSAFYEAKIEYIHRYTNSRFSLAEDILQQMYFTKDVLEDFQKWEKNFIKENIVNMILPWEGDEAKKEMLTDVIMMEDAILGGVLPTQSDYEQYKKTFQHHLELLVAGIEKYYG